MKSLIFISRVAFLSNICMAVAWFMRYADPINDITLQSTIIIAGFVVASIANLIATVWAFIFLVSGKAGRLKPAWLFIINFVCFIFQIYLLVK